MARRKQFDLLTFDGRLLDGLDFCRKVYDLFDQIQGGPDGVARLRLRPTKTEKRLIEELIPLARYIQARYREGRRIKVRWFSGSQPYDAILLSSGGLVEHRIAPRRLLVEVTVAVHQNEHLARRLLHERGGSFGVKGISRNKKTREITSKPHVYTNNELATDLATQILERLRSKGNGKYPSGIVLIIYCITNSLILEPEWNEAMEQVIKAEAHLPFREVFLLESIWSYSRTLYGQPQKARRKSNA